jgi:replication factor C subunit 1
MDEVDGMSSGDRGGIAEIARICRTAAVSFPILCIANDRQSPKIRPLASVALDLRFARPTKTTIAKSLVALLKAKEGLDLRVGEVEDLCERNGNDIRSILNSLQFLHDPSGCGEKDGVHRMDPFSAAGRVFGASASLREREEAVFVDTGLVPLMVAEGYVSAAQKSRSANTVADQLADIAKAAESLTMWDVLDTRIHRQQAWGLLPAAVSAVVTAARAVDGPAPFQIFPAWLGKQSKRTKHRRLLRDVQGHLQGSQRGTDPALMDTRDLLRTRLFQSTMGPKERVAALDALGLTRDDMLETLVETVFTGDEASVALDTKAKSALTREWKKAHPPLSGTTSTAAELVDVDDDQEEDDC